MSNLKKIRKDRHLSQAQLAALTIPPTSQVQVMRIENGQRKLTREWAERFATALDCHWLDLMADEDAPPIPKGDEASILEKYRGLSEPDRDAVFKYIDFLSSQKNTPS